MSEEQVIQQCSPTLAGIKTGNLFTSSYESAEKTEHAVSNLNRRFSNKGLRVTVLKYGKRALIYIFRPKQLYKDIHHHLAQQILLPLGYDISNIDKCLSHLMNRLRTCSDFPHEIGLFLGYPPEDVEGFIVHKGQNCKSFGCWKVYHNHEAAHRCFQRFKQCTAYYCEQFARGCSIDSLAVAQ